MGSLTWVGEVDGQPRGSLAARGAKQGRGELRDKPTTGGSVRGRPVGAGPASTEGARGTARATGYRPVVRGRRVGAGPAGPGGVPWWRGVPDRGAGNRANSPPPGERSG